MAFMIEAFHFDPDVIRMAGALLLLLFGVSSLLPTGQELVSRLMAPLASRASVAAGNRDQAGLAANFFVGSLLGAVWSPCAGPTLGSAIGLVTQAGTLFRGLVLILTFGLGARFPLLAVHFGSPSII